jgi:hypothetical protein
MDAPTTDTAGDVSGQDAPGTDAGGCTGTDPKCASGTAGGECGDIFTSAQCAGGAWKCPTGMVTKNLCGCFNTAPGCHTGTAGGVCGAAITTPTCGGGLWNCPSGMIPSYQCGCVRADDAGAGDAGCP